jgi:hypothetical protein
MSDLSPQLKELVEAGKSASRPSDADAARVLAALRSRLGDAAVLGAEASGATASGSAGVSLGKAAAATVTGLALVGGLWFFAARNPRVASSAAASIPRAVATEAVEVPLAPSVAAVESAAPALPQLEPVPIPTSNNTDRDSRSSAAPRARDSLSEEVAILSRAETALHSGKPQAALKLLDEHERKFKHGLLTEERIAARVQALCALGRTAEADAQLARLSPKSLQSVRARQACNSRNGD